MKELYVICQPDRKNKWSGLYIKKKMKFGLGK